MALMLVIAAGRANGGSSAAPSILFAGGIGTKRVAGVLTIITLSSAEVFDPNRGASGAFVPTGSMKIARTGHTATRLKSGAVLVAGGSSELFGGGTIFASAELYGSSSKRFTMTGALPEPRTGHTATLLADGKVLIACGDDGTTSLTDSELYDPGSATFLPTGAMSIGRDECTATRLANGKILIAGGYQLLPDFSGPVLDTAEIFDPDTGSFSPTGTMTSPREGATATLLPSGKVLIAGGADNYQNTLDTAELYDPPSGQFSQTGHMTTSRYGDLAAALGDGDVLIAGGIDNRGASLSSAELFEAGTGKFVRIAPMPRDRFYVAATALTDKTILVAGGYKQCSSSAASFCLQPVKSALIFDHRSDTFSPISSMTAARGSFASASVTHGGGSQ